jgi:hypothetical protein
LFIPSRESTTWTSNPLFPTSVATTAHSLGRKPKDFDGQYSISREAATAHPRLAAAASRLTGQVGTFPRLTPWATGCHRFAIKTRNKRESRSDGSM